jgi:hypothetical protein
MHSIPRPAIIVAAALLLAALAWVLLRVWVALVTLG